MTSLHKALVVEDDPDISDLLVLSLESGGLEVKTARTGAEALTVARENEPDLITLDLTLPDMDGVEICRRLREFTDAYIIMITGRTDQIDRLQGLQGGADDHSDPEDRRPNDSRMHLQPPRDGRLQVSQ